MTIQFIMCVFIWVDLDNEGHGTLHRVQNQESRRDIEPNRQ